MGYVCHANVSVNVLGPTRAVSAVHWLENLFDVSNRVRRARVCIWIGCFVFSLYYKLSKESNTQKRPTSPAAMSVHENSSIGFLTFIPVFAHREAQWVFT